MRKLKILALAGLFSTTSMFYACQDGTRTDTDMTAEDTTLVTDEQMVYDNPEIVEEKPGVLILASYNVSDYAKMKDGLSKEQNEFWGVQEITRSVDNPNEVTVMYVAKDRESAQRLIAQNAQNTQQMGVQGTPKFETFEVIEDFQNKAVSGDNVFLMTINTSDYEGWRTSFEQNANLRKEHGLEVVGVYRSIDNPNQITVAMEADNIEAAKKYAASPGTNSGVSGTPQHRYLKIDQDVQFDRDRS